MKKISLFLVFYILATSLFAHNNNNLPLENRKDFKSTHQIAQIDLQQGHITSALVQYAHLVKQAQEKRNGGRGVDAELLAEYAYTLALNHDFEAALINIDRARTLGTKYGDFYSAQILLLMGHDHAAEQLMKHAKTPIWMNGVYQSLNQKYATTISINQDTPEKALVRANKLAAQRQFTQAIAIFEELKTLYPDFAIIYIDYSAMWESLGYYGYAEKLLQTGIEKIPQSVDAQNKQVFIDHLTEVNTLKNKYEDATWVKKILGIGPPKLMTYFGTSIAEDMFSLNQRMGMYSSNQFSASLNIGMNYVGKIFSGSIGVSVNKAWGIWVVGLGLSDQFSEDSNIFSFSPSIGLSFLNKAQTSSFDITLNGYIPFSSKQKFNYSFSIGKTIYFDFNRLLK